MGKENIHEIRSAYLMLVVCLQHSSAPFLARGTLLTYDIVTGLPCLEQDRGPYDMHATCRDFPECIPRGKLKPHTLDLAWKHHGAEAKLILPTRSCVPSHFVTHTPCCPVHYEA
jgi:hypothetical protein